MFNLEIVGKAAERLTAFVNDGAKILLDLDDGVGQFATGAASCTMDTAFRLIIVDQAMATPDYQLAISSNIGTIYAKEHSKTMLISQMKLAYQPPFNQLALTGLGEEIDPNVQIKNLYVHA
ncbi:iron-sulfur cluster biosynthesis family protein [Periweissella ghanensis]|uniref:Core domain-containing protein n=1 Tax=Periweissella ghanensis TaxID=467997 RepID=A0ABM8ZDU1_9LACO|nr:iron-sulfur cluster biosynthesis family protein [Periweissella ghanensis]MCM0601434.1 iron-sulfur cluster biosynthesis family protein [Periweissella ghanensis]CAH0419485.1 hypothetical protein WGH24286_01944 [Periweissella ghanensis]